MGITYCAVAWHINCWSSFYRYCFGGWRKRPIGPRRVCERRPDHVLRAPVCLSVCLPVCLCLRLCACALCWRWAAAAVVQAVASLRYSQTASNQATEIASPTSPVAPVCRTLQAGNEYFSERAIRLAALASPCSGRPAFVWLCITRLAGCDGWIHRKWFSNVVVADCRCHFRDVTAPSERTSASFALLMRTQLTLAVSGARRKIYVSCACNAVRDYDNLLTMNFNVIFNLHRTLTVTFWAEKSCFCQHFTRTYFNIVHNIFRIAYFVCRTVHSNKLCTITAIVSIVRTQCCSVSTKEKKQLNRLITPNAFPHLYSESHWEGCNVPSQYLRRKSNWIGKKSYVAENGAATEDE